MRRRVLQGLRRKAPGPRVLSRVGRGWGILRVLVRGTLRARAILAALQRQMPGRGTGQGYGAGTGGAAGKSGSAGVGGYCGQGGEW